MNTGNRELLTTSIKGLNHSLPPMKLYHKAKELGIWNPADIDFTQDILDWKSLNDEEQDVLLRLTSLFQAGEESVTRDLLPLIMAISKEGRIEEELFLTSFLSEEAKHTEFFRRFLDEVACINTDLTNYHTSAYKFIIYEELPKSLEKLNTNPSPVNQVNASVTYNMIVEGVLAETGYHGYYAMLERNNIMPGLRNGISKLKRDESRHIAYGVYLLSRLVAENDTVWDEIEKRMNELLTPALNIINEIFEPYDPMPFELKVEDFLTFAMNQFQRRMNRIEKAKHRTLEEINKMEITD